MEKSALILFAHGARDPAWAEPFHRLCEFARERAPSTTVRLAFLELMEPRLPDTIATLAAQGITHIRIAPVFVSEGAHLKRDLPGLVAETRAHHPHLTIEILSAMGADEEMLKQIAGWALRGWE